MKVLFLALLALSLGGSTGLAQSKSTSIGDLSCPPGSFYSAKFEICMPASSEPAPAEKAPVQHCPAGYIYSLATQTCSKGSGSGTWKAPADDSGRRCLYGSYFDDKLQKCVRNQY